LWIDRCGPSAGWGQLAAALDPLPEEDDVLDDDPDEEPEEFDEPELDELEVLEELDESLEELEPEPALSDVAAARLSVR
jgi:hypothetical protein